MSPNGPAFSPQQTITTLLQAHLVLEHAAQDKV